MMKRTEVEKRSTAREVSDLELRWTVYRAAQLLWVTLGLMWAAAIFIGVVWVLSTASNS